MVSSLLPESISPGPYQRRSLWLMRVEANGCAGGLILLEKTKSLGTKRRVFELKAWGT